MTDPSHENYQAASGYLWAAGQNLAVAHATLAAVDELREIRRLLERIAGPEPQRHDPPGTRQGSGPPAGVPPHTLITGKHPEEDR